MTDTTHTIRQQPRPGEDRSGGPAGAGTGFFDTSTPHGQLVEVAYTVCRQAMELVAAHRARMGDVTVGMATKSSAADPVTVVDRAAEEFIAARLAALRPDDGLVGEEGLSGETASGITWIIDPIDGTVNFLYGLPSYAVSLAAADADGTIVAGAVGNVATGCIYAAARGQGAGRTTVGVVSAGNPATADGGAAAGREISAQVFTPLSPSGCRDIGLALCATGFAYLPARRKQQAHILTGILPVVRDIRRTGSAALDLCLVAEGKLDCYYEHGLNPWDWAAGALVAAEAGCALVLPRLEGRSAHGEVLTACAPGIAGAFAALAEQAGVTAALPL
ncbi:inositol monophosphatase family protein [Corynebacterium mendelii]